MILLIICLFIIFILYLEYKEYKFNQKKLSLEDYEVNELIKHCNPNIIQFYKDLNHYDKRLIQIYITELLNKNHNNIYNNIINKKDIYNKFKTTSYIVCSKYILDIVNNSNTFINSPMASVLGHICQSYL
jgi:hypothetical protein